MFLSYKYKFLFVHIAKTGGTSVRASLKRERIRDPWQIPLFICSRISHMTGHRLGIKFPRHAKVIAAVEMLPRELFNQLYKFAFVRNPWDLQVSSFHHIQRERPHLMQGMTDYKVFLRWKLDSRRPYQYHIDTSIERQMDYLVDMKNNMVMDFIGKYENLQEDFDFVCKTLGLPLRQLPHHRQAKDRKEYRKYYDDESAAWVAEYFKQDIEKFGYTF